MQKNDINTYTVNRRYKVLRYKVLRYKVLRYKVLCAIR